MGMNEASGNSSNGGCDESTAKVDGSPVPQREDPQDNTMARMHSCHSSLLAQNEPFLPQIIRLLPHLSCRVRGTNSPLHPLKQQQLNHLFQQLSPVVPFLRQCIATVSKRRMTLILSERAMFVLPMHLTWPTTTGFLWHMPIQLLASNAVATSAPVSFLPWSTCGEASSNT